MSGKYSACAGWIVAECPLIPGNISQGKDKREAVANIREAIELCIEAQPTEAGGSLASTA